MNRALASAVNRLADQNSDRLADIPAARLFRATVVAVAAGASPGGNALLTLRWRGQEITASDYGAHYTPAVGQRVTCALFEDQVSVIQHALD